MTLRRPLKYAYICRRCGCSCDSAGTRHLGGGSSDMRACSEPPVPVLRTVAQAEARGAADEVRRRCRWLTGDN